MSIPVACSHCQARIRAADAAAGRMLQCPKCGAPVPVPEEELETAEEVPDEVEERPRKKKRAAKRGVPPIVFVAVGSVLATLAVVGVLALTGAFSEKKPNPVVQADTPQPAPPAPPKQPPVPPGPAPAPEEADPFRPADPAAAAALAALDRLAERQPAIPQDAARAKTARAARLEWTRKTMDLAFDRVGRTDAPWAEKARNALLLRAKELAALNDFSVRADSLPAPSTAALAEAVAGGCDDPLVLYYHNKALLSAGRIPRDQFLPEARRVTQAVWDSRYPDVRKLYAVHNLVAALREQGGKPDEITTWNGRFWELLGRVCREDDAVAQEHVIELALLREIGALAVRRTREQGHREFATFLAENKAPEYTQLVVKGTFMIRHAWDARGSGLANTVTAEGFRLFAERLEAAEDALTSAHDLAPDRPHAPTRMLTVCMGRGHPRGEMEKWFERAMRAEPDNLAACSSKLEYLHPKWHGSDDDYFGFAWQCVRTRNSAGLLPFAAVANITANAPIPDPITPAALARLQAYYSHPQIWHLIDAATSALRRDRPELLWLRGKHARSACVAGRYEVAVRELAAVGDDYGAGGFNSPAELAFYRSWAQNRRLPSP